MVHHLTGWQLGVEVAWEPGLLEMVFDLRIDNRLAVGRLFPQNLADFPDVGGLRVGGEAAALGQAGAKSQRNGPHLWQTKENAEE